MNKYKNKIPRDDLKRFAKELAKKLVASDFKAGRVKNPTKIDEKQQKKVKEYCKQYFEKAAQKHKKNEHEKAVTKATKESATSSAIASPVVQSPAMDLTPDTDIKRDTAGNDDVETPDDSMLEESGTPLTPSQQNGTLKRKWLNDSDHNGNGEDDTAKSPLKKPHMDTPPPPPPPPPPAGTPSDTASPIGTMEVDTDIHADTNFKSKSMADVLAQAQEESTDDQIDMRQGHRHNTRFEEGLEYNGFVGNDVDLDNPMVDGQEPIQEMKDHALGAGS